MKKVLQILPELDLINGGVERGTLDVAKELIDKGFGSAIISSGGVMADKYKYKGVSHDVIDIKRKNFTNFFFLRRKFQKLLNTIKPDLVHIRSRWPAFCFNSVVKSNNIPLVTTYHGTYNGNNFFLKRNYNKVMTDGDTVITISKFIDDHVRYNFPDVKPKLCQIDRGIDCNYFDINSVTQIRKESILRSLSITEKTHIILLPARISRWKGHLIAIDAVKKIIENRPELNFVLLLVGGLNKVDFSNKLKKIIKKNDLGGRIVFAGNISDMPAVYSISDIILSTSIEPEAFGRVSAEGCAMSKPVIASKHGGSKEIIENNKTGWLVEPGSSEELSKKIIQVLELKQEDKDLIGNNGRRRVKKKFSLELMLDKTLNVYEELIDRKKSSNY